MAFYSRKKSSYRPYCLIFKSCILFQSLGPWTAERSGILLGLPNKSYHTPTLGRRLYDQVLTNHTPYHRWSQCLADNNSPLFPCVDIKLQKLKQNLDNLLEMKPVKALHCLFFFLSFFKFMRRKLLRNLINELKSSKDCFDGLILNSKTFRLKELARHLGIKTRFKVRTSRVLRPRKEGSKYLKLGEVIRRRKLHLSLNNKKCNTWDQCYKFTIYL